MKQMDQTQALTLENFWVERLQKDFRSARITDDEMCDALRWANEEFDYVADPHTAVALGAAKKLGYSFTDEKPIQVVILATASPIKFQNVVTLTIGEVGWGKCVIPIRAKEINEKTEIEPFHYFWKEGATIEEVQSEWRRKMLEIVDHF